MIFCLLVPDGPLQNQTGVRLGHKTPSTKKSNAAHVAAASANRMNMPQKLTTAEGRDQENVDGQPSTFK